MNTNALYETGLQQQATVSALRTACGDARTPRPLTFRDFTPRKRDVLKLLCDGLPNKVISSRLAISPGTVKIHVSHILRRLVVSSRLQAVIAARKVGLLPE